MRGISIRELRHELICISLIIGLYFIFSLTIQTKSPHHKSSDIEFANPHLVIGILSHKDAIERRTAVRNTWILTALQMQRHLPFRITYKFVLDKPTNVSVKENKLFNDIIYLNVTNQGWGVKFGEKVYLWYKFAHRSYPDALLTARIDDDVFLCVPEVFDRLNEVKSSTLYYGYEEIDDNPSYLDEMFIVLGNSLVKRIAEREYCGKPKCTHSDGLIDTNFGSTSLQEWLSSYKDVNFVADNSRIIHVRRGKAQFDRYKDLITGEFCNSYVAFHKALPTVMKNLHNLTLTNNFSKLSSSFDIPGAATGAIFSGKIIRPRKQVFLPSHNKTVSKIGKGHNCLKWAVVSTIFPPSDAVKELTKLSDWCIVIVADEKTPTKSKYFEQLSINEKLTSIKYLSISEQHSLYPLLSHIIPMNSIGRKNIGYLYAIQNKANMIWDFDDDNIGIIDTKRFSPFTNRSSYVNACVEDKAIIVNPYNYFGVNETRAWPRGFPLQSIKDQNTVPKICNITGKLEIGVIQSLANHQPDVDAVYRLTRELPFQFSATIESHKALVIPLKVFSPFNAQATLWFPSSFEYLALPVSINGRVSDIWRSYIAQYFMHRNNIHVAFSPPFVTQERNPHSIIKDFNAELDIYDKSERLLEFLSQRQVSPHEKGEKKMEALYDDLYMRNYLHERDVEFIKAWETTLSAVKHAIS